MFITKKEYERNKNELINGIKAFNQKKAILMAPADKKSIYAEAIRNSKVNDNGGNGSALFPVVSNIWCIGSFGSIWLDTKVGRIAFTKSNGKYIFISEELW